MVGFYLLLLETIFFKDHGKSSFFAIFCFLEFCSMSMYSQYLFGESREKALVESRYCKWCYFEFLLQHNEDIRIDLFDKCLPYYKDAQATSWRHLEMVSDKSLDEFRLFLKDRLLELNEKESEKRENWKQTMIDAFLKDKLWCDMGKKLKMALTDWGSQARLRGEGIYDWVYDVSLATLAYWQNSRAKEPCMPKRSWINVLYIEGLYHPELFEPQDTLIIGSLYLPLDSIKDDTRKKILRADAYIPYLEDRQEARKRILKEVNKYLDCVEKTYKEFSLWADKRERHLKIDDKVHIVYLKVQDNCTQEEIASRLGKPGLSQANISKVLNEMAELIGIKI